MLMLQNIRKAFLVVNQTSKFQPVQPLWGYVSIAFNNVDADRLAKVGPDRLCIEWLLKNGGAARVVEFPSKLLRDYNSLPPESQKLRVKVADATGASIMKIGLQHFRGCHHIDTVIFHDCKYLEEDGLEGLEYLKSSLQVLQVSGNGNITNAGLKIIGELKNLKQLQLFDLSYVKNLEEAVKDLQKQLPQCKIDTKPIK